MVGSVANLLRGLRLDPIQHPGHNEFHGLPHDSKNGDRNEQADNWIGFRITEVDSKSADKDCKTGPSISSGVVPICSEGGTTNPVSYTHLRAHETRHDLVCRLL